MGKETREYYSFVPMNKPKILDCIKEKYGEYEKSNEEYVEGYYKFKNKCFIKVYKDKYKDGKKERNGKILMYGRNEDYQEFREKDMRLNGSHVEESKADSPLISELNFKYQTIGSDESGKGETFKYLVITAAYVDGANDVKRFIKLGVDDSKEIEKKIQIIGKEVTHIHSWDELLKNLDEKKLFVTDCSVTKIITNEEYNKRCCEKGENINDIIKEAHLEVLREVYKNHPNSMIVVDNFYGESKKAIAKFKEELSSGDFPTDSDHIFMTVKADSKVMAVSLASVISVYICNLGYDYVQKVLDDYKKDPEEELFLHSNKKENKKCADEALVEFFLKLKPDLLEDFINKYTKKNFTNVQAAINKMKQK